MKVKVITNDNEVLELDVGKEYPIPYNNIKYVEGFVYLGVNWEKVLEINDAGENEVVVKKVVLYPKDEGSVVVKLIEDKVSKSYLTAAFRNIYKLILTQINDIINKESNYLLSISMAMDLLTHNPKESVVLPLNEYIGVVCKIEKFVVPLPNGDIIVIKDEEGLRDYYKNIAENLSKTIEILGKLREIILLRLETLEKEDAKKDFKRDLKLMNKISKMFGGL